MRRMTSLIAAPLFAAGAFFVAAPAQAGIGACGDIHVEANANCEVKLDVECKASCEPLSFTASCQVSCSGECNASFSAMCSASCEADCVELECTGGNIDCSASCSGTCGANCTSSCSASNDKAQCEASCEAGCDADCSASCEGSPVECSGGCKASCEGSCTAEANVDCQISCQGGCTAQLQGGCEAECDVDGALFCDGQYVDHGGNLQSCIDALRDQLNIEVSGSASSSCDGGSCEAQAEGSISGCATTGNNDSDPAPLFMLLGALGLAITLRQSR
jgi:hypothetical protein